MKIKTCELSGVALDWAVANTEKKLITLLAGVMVRDNDGMLSPSKNNPLVVWQPSTDWSQGGPIIERSLISVQVFDDTAPNESRWNAYMPGEMPMTSEEEINGPTPLIAAMRCYVASRLGNEVDVPDELAK